MLVDGVSVGALGSYTFTGVTAAHTISASFAVTIAASAGTGGSISPLGAVSVVYGASQTFTITAATGYHVAGVLVDGVSQGALSAYTFPAVSAGHTITASFAIDTFTITASAGAGGRISPSGAVSVNFGATPAFSITPNVGYHIAGVLVDGVSQGALSAYTFPAVSAGHTIAASFAINTYTITPSAGANGVITPATTQTVTYGSTPTFAITAATGYYVADVLVDGASVGPMTKYTFSDVTADHTITASFAVGVQMTFSIGVSKSIVDYGGSTVLRGTLYSAANPLQLVGMGAQPVTVQSSSSTAGPWADLNTLTTSSIAGSVGTFALTVTPSGPTYYRLRFLAAANSGYGSVLSYFVRVGVRPVLGTPTMPLSVRLHKSITVRGTLHPRFPAGQKTVQIGVYRLKHRRWVLTSTVSAVNVDSGATSTYRATLKLAARGKYRLRAYTVATVTWAGDTTPLSKVLTVR